MRKNVRISESPISVWLEGVVCSPSAWRRKWKTISSRANGVMHSRMEGISVSAVSMTTMDHGTDSPCMP